MTIPTPPPTPPSPSNPAPVTAPAPSLNGPHWQSEELLAGGDEALIVHAGQVYRLRRTGTGKLILTK